MSANITLFTSDPNTSSGGSSDYVIDNFQDTTTPATNNLGLTDNANTNPLAQYFVNCDSPQYANKTLYVKDLVLIQDRSRWVNNRPTYVVEFTEYSPYIFAYVWGNVRLRNQQQGLCIQIKNSGDGFGITGLVRNVSWGINPTSMATAQATLSTDGVAGATINFNSAASGVDNEGVNNFYFVKHQASLESQDLHDYRIQASNYNTLNIGQVQVYAENSSANVQCNYGTTYINKFKSVTSAAVGLTLPIMTGNLGAHSVVAKTASNTYDLSTLETQYISTIGIGSSGSNLVNLTTGHGASFGSGYGIVAVSGTSYYIGAVQSVSTDTLTVSPALTFGLSGLLYKAWSSGSTLVIGASAYALADSVDLTEQNNFNNADGFAKETPGDYYYSAPDQRFRLWGKNLAFSQIEGYPGVAFNGATGFLQLDFFGAALDMEYVANGIMAATFIINGAPCFSLNEGATGAIKKTIMADGGPSWNTVRVAPGASYGNLAFTKLNIYDRSAPGTSFGVLSEFDTAVTKAYRYTHNASMMSLGPWQRIYGDNLYFSGNWIRGTTTTVAGNVFYVGSTNSCALSLNYFGNDFAFIGTLGASSVCLLDGASIGIVSNQVKIVPGTTFHTLQLQVQSGTFIISAVDFARPATQELVNTQNIFPRPELPRVPRAFFQSDTPRNAHDGDSWCKDINQSLVYFRLAGRWFQMSVASNLDDPNGVDVSMVHSHGTSAVGSFADSIATVETFNFVAWTTGDADTTARSGGQGGNVALGSNHYFIDGITAAGAISVVSRAYNKVSWSAAATRTTARSVGGASILGSNLVVGKGGTASNADNDKVDVFNGTSWTNSAGTLATAISIMSCATQNNIVRWVAGCVLSTSGVLDVHETWNGTSVGTDTVLPVTNAAQGGSSSANNAMICSGFDNAATYSYQWNGSWSAAITFPYLARQNSQTSLTSGLSASGFNSGNNFSYVTGGDGTPPATVATTAAFNGISWSSSVASNITSCSGSGAIY